MSVTCIEALKEQVFILALLFCFMQFEYLKPMETGEILDASVKLYRRNFTLLVAAQLPMTILSLARFIFQTYGLGAASISPFSFLEPEEMLVEPVLDLSWFWGLLILLLLQIVVIKPIALSAITRIASDSILDTPSFKKGYQFFFKNWWKLILTYAIPYILLYLIASILGIFCCVGVIIACFLWARWLLAFPVAANDNTFMLRSLDRSWNLVKDHTWNTFLVMTLISLIPFVVQLSAYFVGLYLAGNIIFLIIVFAILSEGLIVPLVDTARVVIYFQLRARKEGFDLEKRVEALEGTELP